MDADWHPSPRVQHGQLGWSWSPAGLFNQKKKHMLLRKVASQLHVNYILPPLWKCTSRHCCISKPGVIQTRFKSVQSGETRETRRDHAILKCWIFTSIEQKPAGLICAYVTAYIALGSSPSESTFCIIRNRFHVTFIQSAGRRTDWRFKFQNSSYTKLWVYKIKWVK